MTADQKPMPARSKNRVVRHPEFEADLGARIRRVRFAVGVSQSVLAASLGLSFQQIQKYENGTDRVAVGTLNAMASYLGVSPIAFFCDDPDLVPLARIEVPEAQRIGKRVLAIGDRKLIRRVMNLVDMLGRDRRLGENVDHAD